MVKRVKKIFIILIFLLVLTNIAIAEDQPTFVWENISVNSSEPTTFIWEDLTIPESVPTISEPTIEISGLQTIIILIVIIIVFIILLIEFKIRKMNRPK